MAEIKAITLPSGDSYDIVDAGARESIANLQSIGRFLALWDCTTGMPLSNPIDHPYTYHTGDYFRVNKVAVTGGTNYMPNGSSYQGVASTTPYVGDIAVADIFFYDGTTWSLQINHSSTSSGGVTDVQVNGASVVSNNVAYIDILRSEDYLTQAEINAIIGSETIWNGEIE